MALPVWSTPQGNIGAFRSNVDIEFTLQANPVFPSSGVTYALHNGLLPAGLSLTNEGKIIGKPEAIVSDTAYEFTVRAKDNAGKVRDRTFSIFIYGGLQPSFITATGLILSTVDSVWVEKQLDYTPGLDPDKVNITLISGNLPPGLEVNKKGLIRGYPAPPVTPNGKPTTKIYKFTLKLVNDLGTITSTFEIQVSNHNLSYGFNTRKPVILNYRPPTFNIPEDDPISTLFLSDNKIPPVKSGNFFTFKIIGKDFDEDDLTYEFFDLPVLNNEDELGLYGDPESGWIRGTPVLNYSGYNNFYFSARAVKSNGVVSERYEFVFTVYKDLDPEIIWKSPFNLGIINNNTVSDFKIEAESNVNLTYELVSGNLPPNLKLLENGEIIGKVVHQPQEKLLSEGEYSNFDFTVKVYATEFPALQSFRTFTIQVYQYFKYPTETMYFKASPSLADRKILDSLLKDESLMPKNLLYRPDDIYYGKATEVRFVQVYGINAGSIEKYVDAIEQNHYWRNVTLGELKTAVAKDDEGNIIYEVVYSEVIDELANKEGKSVDKRIRWPKFIELNKGPWVTSEGEVFTSYVENKNTNTKYTTNLSPGYALVVYPASFSNMRTQIADKLDENYDSKLLPRWMRSQQENGSIPGYVQCWVLCYTKPGQAKEIRDNINNKWPHKLNKIAFQLDRYTVDKSTTYEFNTYLSTPSWQNLPSTSPELENLDQKDFYVLFPKKTILPK